MKLALLLLVSALAATGAPNRLVVMDETVEVPAAEWRAFDLDLRQQPAWIDCRFSVRSTGSGVRVALLRRADVERMRDGQPHRILGTTDFQRAGLLRQAVPAGDYSLVVDNRLEGRGPAEVYLQVGLLFVGPGPKPHVLSPARKAVVVALSILFFVAVAGFAGWKLLRAASQNRGAPPPAFWG